MPFEYSDCPYPIRDDIAQAHREAWRRITGIQEELGLESFESAKNSRPPGLIGRGLGKLAGAVLPRLLRLVRG